ncbi:Rad52/Rad22 family DNA repair protein [Veillonella montpellierensis]|uniref:Rad52/Rad22 family DNA repair protein n=1 Tax=Veillonella montpellierensis TaxID=187328 RepID=UPI000690D002|nr:Rad52/Rad22 family DNA repair protein [Veillonella montpellierensis]
MLVEQTKVFEELKKPFAPEDIEWRVGRKSKDKTKGTALAYLNARAVADRLDSAVGASNWAIEYTPIDLGISSKLNRDGNATDYKGFLATITLNVKDEDGNLVVVKRSDGANVTDFESIKGGLSGAFKRAASQFGIGRYLYQLKESWVNIDNFGNFIQTPKLPSWALPEGYVHSEKTPTNHVEVSEPTPFDDNYGTAFVPQDEPSVPAGEAVIPAGKKKGELVSKIDDIGYLTWVVNTANGNAWLLIKDAAKARLEELS